ncbi:SUMF1/EgtB/PvdO family nonheme iron enzyme [Ruegeria jejuensis]|uniref:SUMF1/EgtB/PvdO family nonheme iron enzyme n=1 Tax=Ruegeria jejuensis TaxID=3233338 RepID=UPI00355C3A92
MTPGPGSNWTGPADHPVVKPAKSDAPAFGGRAGGRLPSEAERECAQGLSSGRRRAGRHQFQILQQPAGPRSVGRPAGAAAYDATLRSASVMPSRSSCSAG